MKSQDLAAKEVNVKGYVRNDYVEAIHATPNRGAFGKETPVKAGPMGKANKEDAILFTNRVVYTTFTPDKRKDLFLLGFEIILFKFTEWCSALSDINRTGIIIEWINDSFRKRHKTVHHQLF